MDRASDILPPESSTNDMALIRGIRGSVESRQHMHVL